MKKQNAEIRADHELIRNKVGTFDFTMSTIEITGKDARSFLDEMMVNKIAQLEAGKVMYTSILNDDAVMIDDVTVYCFGSDKFWMITAFPDTTLPWFTEHLNGRDVSCKDLSEHMRMWPVQGPLSRKVLNGYLKEKITDMKYYNFAPNVASGNDVYISRTGFTGELGYEIFADVSVIDTIIADLIASAPDSGLRVVESEVSLESLPTEKGLVQERDFGGCNPLEVGMGWSINWDKNFVGKAKLLEVKQNGITRKLVGFIADNDEVDFEAGVAVSVDGKEVGKVTCANYGYTVEKSIGYALLDIAYAEDGKTIQIDGVNATICNRVFYDPKRERINA